MRIAHERYEIRDLIAQLAIVEKAVCVILVSLGGFFFIHSEKSYLLFALLTTTAYAIQGIAYAPLLMRIFPLERYGQFYSVNKVGDLMSLFTNDLETINECFGSGILSFCDALLRLGLQPILTEYAWQSGCGGEMLISSALSGGDLRTRLEEALGRSGGLCLDLERLCRSFPLPCPDGEGDELSPRALAGYLRQGAKPSFSEELMCKAFTAKVGGEMRFILFDDRETLCRKVKLASSLGVRRCFLLYPEWSAEDARAAADALADK